MLRNYAMVVLSAVLTGLGCGKGVTSEVQAQRAYLGLDKSIEKSMALGFAGFKAATNANIPDQAGTGDAQGTLTISGQVDSGVSANKQMRLRIGMVTYADGKVEIPEQDPVTITYDTSTDKTSQPSLTLNLKSIPNGTFDGTLVGDYTMSGDLEGNVHLELTLSGQMEDDGTGKPIRKSGSTAVTGTATSAAGDFEVDLTL